MTTSIRRTQGESMTEDALAKACWALLGDARSSSAVREHELVIDVDKLTDLMRALREARKPWANARPGQVWDVDLEGGGIRAVTVHSADDSGQSVVFRDAFFNFEYALDDTSIRDARRVWPEEKS